MDLPTTEMALRFVLSNPDVSTACSGMNTLEQLEENVRTVRNFDPAQQGDFAAMCEGLDRLRAELGDKFCTACRYCMPCPEGVDIPRHLDLYRQWKAFGLEDAARRGVVRMPEDKSLVRCTKCGACVTACPNDLPVPDMLAELARLAEG